MGNSTDFLVRPWGIRRTRKSVVPLKQQPVTLRVVMFPLTAANQLNQQAGTEVETSCWNRKITLSDGTDPNRFPTFASLHAGYGD
jgi:hypothetical protein